MKSAEEWHGEVLPEKSAANGEVERAVHEAHGLARMIKEDSEIQLKFGLPDKCPIRAVAY